MNKLLLTTAIIISATFSAFAAEQAPPKPLASCQAQLPYGLPTAGKGSTQICRTAYLVDHDPVAKIPVWTAHTLTKEHVMGCLPREDAFAADQSIPKGQRAELADYVKSGYDQGHLVSNADLSWDRQVANESFYLSNMSPQLPALNRGVWKLLETTVRAYTYNTGHNTTVYAGNIWYPTSKTIGPDKVVVPDFLFKIFIDNTTKQSYAFIFPNKEGVSSNLPQFQVTVADVEKTTGLTFPVPDNKAGKNPFPSVDLNKIATDKKTVCK
jgi:endonuclease G